MRSVLISAILLAGLSQAAVAADPQGFVWTKEKFDFVASGDAKKGKKVAKEFKCKRCHNKDGISDDEEIPSIAGQRATYMYKQFMDFKHGVRVDEDMNDVAEDMSEQEIVDVAAWFESQERAEKVGGEAGLQAKVCDSCHDKAVILEGEHPEVAPILAGQMRQYLEDNMMKFRGADRTNDLFVRMQSVSHKLSLDEIKQLARYYGAEDPE